MRKLQSAGLLFMLFFVVSCAGKLIPVNSKNYEVGTIKTATVGSSMIEVENQKVEIGTRWIGVLRSSSGYEEKIVKFKQELIYGGRSGDTIKVSYREYMDDYARPPFYQELQYDLKASNEISFKNFRIGVISADNSKVSYKVIAE